MCGCLRASQSPSHELYFLGTFYMKPGPGTHTQSLHLLTLVPDAGTGEELGDQAPAPHCLRTSTQEGDPGVHCWLRSRGLQGSITRAMCQSQATATWPACSTLPCPEFPSSWLCSKGDPGWAEKPASRTPTRPACPSGLSGCDGA